MHSIRSFVKNMGNPYYEPTIVVHDTYHMYIINNLEINVNIAFQIHTEYCVLKNSTIL